MVIVSAVRTAVGSFGGALLSKSSIELGTIAAKAAISQAGNFILKFYKS